MPHDNSQPTQQTQEEEDEHKSPHHSIDDLITEGIAVTDIEKLKKENYCTLETVAYTPKKTLVNVKGISDAKVQKLQDAAFKLLGQNMSFRSASEYYSSKKDVIKLTTGASKLDDLLGGGIETGSITEIFGEFRTGKTQICHTLCVTCQFPSDLGGGSGCALYIDTEGTFRPERIVQICDRFGMDANDGLDNISYARAYSSDHQMKLLSEAAKMMCEARYALVVVDSATALFRSEYVGRGQLAERQQTLGKFLKQLKQLCDIFGVACVVTNQVVSSPDAMSFGNCVKPIGGNIMAHASTTRLFLRKGSKNSRICKIYSSPNLAECEETFAITDSGIADE